MREKKEFDPNLVQFGTVFVTKTDRSLLGPEDQHLFKEDDRKHVVIKAISPEEIVTLGIMNPEEPKEKWRINCMSGSARFEYITQVIGQLTIDEIVAGAVRFATADRFSLPGNFREMITNYQKQSLILNFPD